MLLSLLSYFFCLLIIRESCVYDLDLSTFLFLEKFKNVDEKQRNNYTMLHHQPLVLHVTGRHVKRNPQLSWMMSKNIWMQFIVLRWTNTKLASKTPLIR